MKTIYFLLIAALIVGCGPSAEQMTATANAARALTQTAAPTLTPTITFTPSPSPTVTPSPTLTPSPTPSIPKVQGRLQINYVPLTDDATVPPSPTELTLTLKSGGKEIRIKGEADGSFTAYMEPGKYTVSSLTIKNKSLGSTPYEIFTDEAVIEIPSQPCYYAGSITFLLLRLPAGSIEEQFALVQQVAQGADVYLQYFESGGFIMPALTEVAGAGDCPQLPESPEGFNWQYLPESSLAVLAPSEWYFLSEPGGGMQNYFISKENIATEGSFKTGLTINVIRNDQKNAVQVAKGLPSSIIKLAGVDAVEVNERTDGGLTFYEFEYTKDFIGYRGTVHQLIVASEKTNTVYVITFEGLSEEWEQVWKVGEVILSEMIFLDSQ